MLDGHKCHDKLTVLLDIDQSGHLMTRLLIKDHSLVPLELLDNFAEGHGVTFQECKHVLVACHWSSVTLSLKDHVGIVDVDGVDRGVGLTVGCDPFVDVFVIGRAPEVLVGLEDLWRWTMRSHDVVVSSFLSVVRRSCVFEIDFSWSELRKGRQKGV